MPFRAYTIKIQFESRPVPISKHNGSLLFMVLYEEALDRLCVRLNMYILSCWVQNFCRVISRPYARWVIGWDIMFCCTRFRWMLTWRVYLEA